MSQHKDSDHNSREGNNLGVQFTGQFILWTVIALVGWSFYSTLQHEVAIAIMEQRLTVIEHKLRIR